MGVGVISVESTRAEIPLPQPAAEARGIELKKPGLVVVAGHLCLDIFPDLSAVPAGQLMHLLKPGRLVSTGAITFATGGAVSNTGQALVRLGVPTRLIAKVGDDPFAAIVRGVVRRTAADLDAGIISTPGTSTSYTVILSAPGIDRIFLHCTGANDTFVAGDVDPRELEGAAIFHFGYPPLMRAFYQNDGRELVDLFKRAKSTGVTTSLDMTLPDAASAAGQVDWIKILGAVLPYVDIFLPSVEEILFMLRSGTYKVLQAAAGSRDLVELVTPELLHSLSTQLLQMGARIVGLKLGGSGFYLHTADKDALAGMGRGCPAEPALWANQTLWAPCYAVAVVGTTGAGDAAIAGFLSGLLRGMGPRETLRAAAAVGACNVEAADAQSGLRSWDDTLKRIEAGWKRCPVSLSPADWAWDEEIGLWVALRTL